MEEEIDKNLYKKAKRRVHFRRQLTIGIMFNLVLWIFYIITAQIASNYYHPWPLYVTSLWIIYIIFLYKKAYKWNEDEIISEYEKLKKENKNNP